MSSATNTFENKILDAAFGSGTLTKPANVYVALYSTAPTDSTSGTELTGNGYARQIVSFGSASSGQIASSGNVTFTANASSTWSTAVAVALVDAATAGNIMVYGALAPARTIKNSETINFTVGNLIVTQD
jgi:hypothetical protein